MHSYLPEMGLSHVRHGCIGCFCCVASCEGLRGSSPPNSINIYFPAIVRSSFRVASLILYIVRNSVKVDVITYGRPSSCSNPLFFLFSHRHRVPTHVTMLFPRTARIFIQRVTTVLLYVRVLISVAKINLSVDKMHFKLHLS